MEFDIFVSCLSINLTLYILFNSTTLIKMKKKEAKKKNKEREGGEIYEKKEC